MSIIRCMENFKENNSNQIIPEQIPQNPQFETNNSEEVIKKQEIRTFTREYSPWARKDLADQIKYARTLKSLQTGQKDESIQQINDLQSAFYNRFANQKENFENSKLETDVENISQKYGVVFVHTFPIEGMSRWNTSMNNEQLDANSLTSQDILSNIIKNKPDLSCSSVSIDKRFSSQPDDTMYPIGIVMRGGNILSAYRYDAGTLTEKDAGHKKSKYDPKTQDTSIQENVSQHIDDVLTRKYDSAQNPETGYNDMHQNYKTGELEPRQNTNEYIGNSNSDAHVFDEFVIEKPQIDGLYINMDDQRIKSFYDYQPEMVEKINQFVQGYPDVPVYIKNKGKLTILTYDTEGNARVIDNPDDFKSLKSLST
jgi:hypothetical protein